MTNHQTAGAGVDLARRMIVAYCDGGDREALRIINGAASVVELGYACGSLLTALAACAEIITDQVGVGGRHAALELLRDSASGLIADAVVSEARSILLTEGDGDV